MPQKTAPETADHAERGIGDAGSLARMLGLLDLFTREAPIWTAEEIARYTGQSRSTCYRYIRALQRAGLISPVESGHFVLGSRILELDRQIRECDPLYNAASTAMAGLSAATGHSTLLCGLYSDSVMCIRRNLVVGAPETIHSRGHRRSLFRGALAKVILAYLPAHQLKQIYASSRPEIAAAGLGADWAGFRKILRAIRRDGYCMTCGEAFSGICGIAAPIFSRRGLVLGSVGVAFRTADYRPEDQETLVGAVKAAGEEASIAIRNYHLQLDFAARSINGRRGGG